MEEEKVQINTAAVSFPDAAMNAIHEFQIRRKTGGSDIQGKADANGFPLPFFQSERAKDLIREPLYVINSTGFTKRSNQTADLYFEVATGVHNRIMATWLPYDLTDHLSFLKNDPKFLALVMDGFLTIIPKSVAEYLSAIEAAYKERQRVYLLRDHQLFTPRYIPVEKE